MAPAALPRTDPQPACPRSAPCEAGARSCLLGSRKHPGMGARARARFTRKQEILRANNDMLVGRELAGWDPGLGKPSADSRTPTAVSSPRRRLCRVPRTRRGGDGCLKPSDAVFIMFDGWPCRQTPGLWSCSGRRGLMHWPFPFGNASARLCSLPAGRRESDSL